jgi:single-stranded-DNA-specific exonuclease
MKTVVVKPEIPDAIKAEFSHLPDIVSKLLFYRGISTKNEAEAFLSGEYKTHDPFLMKDMEKATKRIVGAIKSNEKIFIFSDYDADGIPGAVVLNDFFRKINFSNFEIYIPNRDAEGFGLNNEAVSQMVSSGAKLIITVDCGTNDFKEVDLANSLGCDVIITDHHVVGDDLPKAFAVLNPKQKGCSYPEKMLCGAGVAFKLVEGLIKTGTWPINEGWEKWLLDMVGIATLSDMVPLLGENRIFAKYGLAVLRKSPRPGLNALLSLCRIKKFSLNEEDITFSITPRINAASRMGEPMDAFLLLSTKDENEAFKIASKLDALNKKRKTVVAQMLKEMKVVIKERELDKQNVIALGNPDWKPSLLGLVAGNIADEFGKPVFIWGRDGKGGYKGSCRGKGNVGVLQIMNITKGFFSEFGGHDMAGGFSVPEENIYRFSESLQEAFSNLELVNEEQTKEADLFLYIEEINDLMFESIKKLAPFGLGNPKPVFVVKGGKTESVKAFGKDKNHLELIFTKSENKKLSAIAFFKKVDSWGEALEAGKNIDLLATLEESVFKSIPELRLRIVDII